MFKDVFVLKKTSWHVKMMKYIWNLDYKSFSHMCPYWWLSVFNVLIAFIPVFLVKEGYRLLKWILPAFFSILGAIISQFSKYVFVKPGRFIGDVSVSAYKAIAVPIQKKWMAATAVRRERRQLAAEEKKRRQDEYIKELLERIKARGIKEYIEDNKGEIDVETRNKIRSYDYGFFDKLLDGISEFNYRQQEIGRQQAEERQAKWEEERYKRAAKKLDAMWQTEWGQAIGEDPQNTVKKKTARELEEEIRKVKEEKERQRILRNKARIVKLNNFIKPIMKTLAYLIGIVLAALILYGLYLAAPSIWHALVWIWNILVTIFIFLCHIPSYIWGFFTWIGDGVSSVKHETWTNTGKTIMWIFIWLLGIGGILLGLAYLNYLASQRKYDESIKPPTKKRKKDKSLPVYLHALVGLGVMLTKWASLMRPLGLRFIEVGGFIRDAIRGIGRLFVLLVTYLVDFLLFLVKCVRFLIQMLKNQCPAIQWVDEDELKNKPNE